MFSSPLQRARRTCVLSGLGEQMQRRSQQTIDTMLAIPEPGGIALFAHGHNLRALAGTWLGLGATGGQLLQLGTGTISVLGWERETRTLERWNAPTNSRPDD